MLKSSTGALFGNKDISTAASINCETREKQRHTTHLQQVSQVDGCEETSVMMGECPQRNAWVTHQVELDGVQVSAEYFSIQSSFWSSPHSTAKANLFICAAQS